MRRAYGLAPFLLLAACGSTTGAPLDAGPAADQPRPSSCELRLTPSDPQPLRPSERVRFTAQVVPAGTASEVRFALVGEAGDASLSGTRVATTADGSATTELTASSAAAAFRLRATVPCTAEVYVPVSVSDRGFGALDVEALYRGARQPSRLTVTLWRASDCATPPTGDGAGAVEVPAPGATAHFATLPAGADYVVRALALGVGDVALASACAGPARVERDATARLTAVFVDAPLRLDTRYDVALAFDLSSLASSSSPRWVASVTSAIASYGGEAALLGNELAAAVAQAAPAATRDRDRMAFEAVWRDGLGVATTAMLARREVTLAGLFARVAAATAVVSSNPRMAARATATADEPERFTFAALRYVLDPETPDVRGDDAEVPLTTTAALRVSAGLRDAYTIDVDGLTLPWNVLARSALRAWLTRQGVATSAEYVALSACSVVVSAARGASPVCDDACVLAACRRAVATLGSTFEGAVTTLDPPRTTVNLRASATATAVMGALTVDQLMGLASGSFREDASSTAMASMTLARVADP